MSIKYLLNNMAVFLILKLYGVYAFVCVCVQYVRHYPVNINSSSFIFLHFPWCAVSSCEEWVRSNGGDLPTSSLHFWQRRGREWKGQACFAFVYGSFLFVVFHGSRRTELVSNNSANEIPALAVAHNRTFLDWIVHCLEPKYSLNADIPLSITHTHNSRH